MTYTYISSKFLIPEVYSYFNIQSAEWEDRCPFWIADAINGMNIYAAYVDATEEIEVIEYKAKIPITCKRIRDVVREDKVKLLYNDMGYAGYNLEPNEYSMDGGWLNIPIKNGKITLYFDSLPVELDCDTGKYYPLIPNVEALKIALRWYIMRNVLMRGYIHTVFNLKENNAFVNPAMAFEQARGRALVACGSPNSDRRARIGRVLCQFFNTDTQQYRPVYSMEEEQKVNDNFKDGLLR
jgi:hypothetical protein